jgi:hypothetical protein
VYVVINGEKTDLSLSRKSCVGEIIAAGTNCGALGEMMVALKGVAGREGGDVACV